MQTHSILSDEKENQRKLKKYFSAFPHTEYQSFNNVKLVKKTY